MDALLMCGGRGTRLDAAVEKPLFEIGGRPMIDRVIGALEASAVCQIYAVVSPHATDTRDHLDGLARIETPGDGYVADLGAALGDDRVDRPVLTVAADLPALDPEPVDRIVRGHGAASVTVCVPAALKRQLGLSVEETLDRGGDELAPAGVNIVGAGGGEHIEVSYDARLAVNVNRRADARVAEALA